VKEHNLELISKPHILLYILPKILIPSLLLYLRDIKSSKDDLLC
jgi:hypothetical protein